MLDKGREMAATGIRKGLADQEPEFDAIFKLLIIGDANVGKTALLTRFCEDRFQSNFMSTVGQRHVKLC